MKYCGIIPARFKSTRFPGKPLAKLGGVPIVVRVYRQAVKFEKWHQLVVATDDDRIVSVCDDYNVPSIMTSPDHPDCIDRAAEVAETISADRYIVIQGDEPFFDPSSLDVDLSPAIVNLYTQVVDANEIEDSNVVKVVVSKNLKAIYFSRYTIPYAAKSTRKSSDPINVDKQLGVYSFSGESLRQFKALGMSYLEGIEGIGLLRFLENDIEVHMRYAQSDSLSIDTEDDLQRAERLC